MPRPKTDPALAAAMRGLREAKGVTREVLAMQAGITCGALARIELAQASPRWTTVMHIARALDLSISGLAVAVEAAQQSADPTRCVAAGVETADGGA
jgi:transcriptional regulator with XRE-family HTH domain